MNMYHIKQDKRAKASVELICAGLAECLREKPYDKISISDVQRASTVSRSTFYRNFDCLDDVLALMCDNCFAEAFAHGERDLRKAVFEYWFRNSELLEVLVSIRRTDILFDSFRRSAAGLEVTKRLIKDSDTYDYFISIIASVIMGILVTWVEHGRKESQKELQKRLISSFSAMLKLGIL